MPKPPPGAKLLWKIPNQYFAVSAAIDRGVPLMQQTYSEMAKTFAGLAAVLTENDIDVKRKAWSLFKTRLECTPGRPA